MRNDLINIIRRIWLRLERLEKRIQNIASGSIEGVLPEIMSYINYAIEHHDRNVNSHFDLRRQISELGVRINKLPTVFIPAQSFNMHTGFTTYAYYVITDNGTISLNPLFFSSMERQTIIYVRTGGQILISTGLRPEDAYPAAPSGYVRELSIYKDDNAVGTVTVYEKLLRQ